MLMKSKFFFISLSLIFSFIFNTLLIANEQFNFNVTEVEIRENGNKFIGRKRGVATTEDGLFIEADEFEYDKKLNILQVKGKIEFNEKEQNFKIFTDNATYFKNDEIVFTEGNSKAINKDGLIITATKFNYNKIKNILDASGNVKVVDPSKNTIIYSNKITYFKNKEKIFTNGDTEALVEDKYKFFSKDVIFYRNEMKLISDNYSTIDENKLNLYELERFKYFLNDKVLKGEEAKVITNLNKDKSDEFYFKSIFISFKNKKFNAGKTKVYLHDNIFDKERKKFIDLENAKLNELFEDYYEENDPRLYGVSSSGDQDKTIVNKGVFTSCRKTDSCPAWSMHADKITHDKIKKQIIYKDTILKIYDYPVFYFPKFFHPDPSVKRQSGFLKPELNESKILGTSLNLPYFHVVSQNKDITFKPTIFDSEIYMFQNEYRQQNKNSSFIADLGLTKGYQSSIEGSDKNSMTHLFSKFNSDLKLNNFSKSALEIFVEKTSNDTYLSLFDANIPSSNIKPKNKNLLESGFKLNLDHEDYNFSSGMNIYETLSGTNSDRFQYIFPYYNFDTVIETNLKGNINFSSSGSNDLKNTNNLSTKMTNNLNYISQDYFSDLGIRNNYGIYLKNFNATAKNDSKYKSNLQSELMTILEIGSSFPLIKRENKTILNSLTPKISLRYNPTNMKNYTNSSRTISADNIFSINRLGIGDSYESGRSLTLGIDYKKEDLGDSKKFLEFKLATVLRDKFENDIPISSTINRKNSNLYGSFTNNFSEFLKIDYDFAIDNDINTFEYNSIGTEFSINNFVTEFTFIEQNGLMGETNSIENTSSIKFNNNNYFTFNTKRNRKTSLTEYYDLVYEYKNDCLTAGIKYKKTYYSDRDVKPNEDLLFTITLFPLTTLEQNVDQNLYRD
tara:strand:- start:3003 stop:5705 length:2703 start_codon:yes stop_codon:yes gene_type:complete